MNDYLYDYDDPYKLLAHYIVGFYRASDVVRILTDNSYIKNCVLKEVRQMDLGGHFIDCIIENILEDKDRMEYMHQLDKLSEYYYSKLDKERLRKEVRSLLDAIGIELDDHSTAGSVSSPSKTFRKYLLFYSFFVCINEVVRSV